MGTIRKKSVPVVRLKKSIVRESVFIRNRSVIRFRAAADDFMKSAESWILRILLKNGTVMKTESGLGMQRELMITGGTL